MPRENRYNEELSPEERFRIYEMESSRLSAPLEKIRTDLSPEERFKLYEAESGKEILDKPIENIDTHEKNLNKIDLYQENDPDDPGGNSGNPESWTTKTIRKAPERMYQIGVDAKNALTDPNFRALDYAIPVAGPMAVNAMDEGRSQIVQSLGMDDPYLKGTERREKYAQDHPIADMALSIGGALNPMPWQAAGVAANAAAKIPKIGKALSSVGELAKVDSIAGGLTRGAVQVGQGAGNVAANTVIASADAFARGNVDVEEAARNAGGLSSLIEGGKLIGELVATFTRKVVASIPYKLAQLVLNNRKEIDNPELIDKAFDYYVALKKKGMEPKLAAEKAVEEARSQYGYARKALSDEIKGKDISPQLPKEVMDKAKELRKSISAKSSESFDELKNNGISIDLRDVRGFLQGKLSKKYQPVDKKSITSELNTIKAINNELNALIDSYRKDYAGGLVPGTDKNIDPVVAKKFIQFLDDLSRDAYDTKGAGYTNFNPRTIAELRFEIDTILKDANPEYKRLMIPVKESEQLAQKVIKWFPDEQRSFSTIRNLAKPEMKEARDAFDSLMSGTDNIADYEKVKKTWKSATGRQDMNEELPEYANLRQKESELADVTEKLSDIERFSPRFDAGQHRIGRVDTIKDVPIKRSWSAIDDLAEKNPDMLPEGIGSTPSKIADNLAAQDALQRTVTSGSRNVNLGRGIGKTLPFSGGEGLMGAVGAAADIQVRQAWKFMSDMAAHPATKRYVEPLFKTLRERGPQAFYASMQNIAQRDQAFNEFMQQLIMPMKKQNMEPNK